MKSNFKDFRTFGEEVQRIETAKRDFVAPMGKVVMERPDGLTLAGIGAFGLTATGHRQLAEKAGVPWDYYEKTATVTGLREYNINAWTQARPEEKRLIRTLDGNVRAVLSKNFKPMDNYMLMDAILPALREVGTESMLMRTYALTEDHMYLQVGFPLTTRELTQPGVTNGIEKPISLMAGLTFRNSEVGKAKLAVRKTVWNLVCWNGLIAEEVLSMVHLGRELEDGNGNGDNGNIWGEDTLRKEIELIRLRARDIVRDAMGPDSLTAYIAKAERAITNEIERPVEEAIAEVTRRFKFPFTHEEGQLLLENVLEGGKGNRNQWGLVNGINALAHKIENADRQYDVERLSSDVIELKPGEWEELAKN